VFESRIICPTCSSEVEFFTDPLYGRSLEACLCGVRALRPVAGASLKPFGPRHLDKHTKRMRKPVTAKATGKNFITLKVCPECEQEFKCREKMNETGKCTRCSKRQYQREWRCQERAKLAGLKQQRVA
jgi:hypothetical protein